MGDIKISTGEVAAIAQSIRATSQRLDETLARVSSEIRSVNSSWSSTSSNTFMGNYQRLSARYADFKKAVDAYAAFLDKQVSTGYDQVESGINKGASQFG